MGIIIDTITKKPNINKSKRMLCVQPHPDDNEIGMGGAIAYFANMGCEIHYLTVTDGSLGLQYGTMTHSELATTRKNECEKSGKLLGAQFFHYLGYEDGTLDNVHEVAGKIGEIIRSIQPDFVCCPDPWTPYEAHQDHIITGKAVAQSIIAIGLVEYPLGTNTKPHHVKGIGFYHSSRPNTVIDISDTFDSQMKSISMHSSQFDKKTLAMYKLYFKSKAIESAKEEKFKLGCPLKVLGEIHLHCFPNAENI